MRNDLSQKINHIRFPILTGISLGISWAVFTSDVETVSNALQQSFLQIVNAIFT